MELAVDRQLDRWLVQLHAVEQQALLALKQGRRRVGDARLAEHLAVHLIETERHRAAVRRCLSARGRTRSRPIDLAASVNRAGFLIYGALSRDSPGKLLADAFAYEFFEIAAYRMLERGAAERGDVTVEAVALSILRDEEAMAARLEDEFDRGVAASLRVARCSAGETVLRHLCDLHALEAQAGVLFAAASRFAGSARLAGCYRDQAARSRRQRASLGARITSLNGAPSALKTGVMRIAGAAWSVIWAAQRDTAAKLACFGYAALHLEIASYELLRREAAQTGDRETEALAVAHLESERAGAGRLGELLEEAALSSLVPSGMPLGASL
ncbi:MAG TPA: DUF892 family protein [Solirubrobacteraceae bacterium]|nr:DUF892 family protein [Solirubrobacteraceae bacterium]